MGEEETLLWMDSYVEATSCIPYTELIDKQTDGRAERDRMSHFHGLWITFLTATSNCSGKLYCLLFRHINVFQYNPYLYSVWSTFSLIVVKIVIG